VLQKEFEQIAIHEGWAVVRKQVEPRHNTDEGLTELISTALAVAKARMSRTRTVKATLAGAVSTVRRAMSVEYQDISWSLNGDASPAADINRSLYNAVEAALETGHEGFALLLDEAQVIRDDTTRHGEHPLSLLIAAANALQEAGLPLALVMCGLPTLGTNLQRARTYSERLFRAESIAELSGNPGPARDAFVKTFERVRYLCG